jgi:hypothetical protein
MKAANSLQDRVRAEQASVGTEVPDWDEHRFAQP